MIPDDIDVHGSLDAVREALADVTSKTAAVKKSDSRWNTAVRAIGACCILGALGGLFVLAEGELDEMMGMWFVLIIPAIIVFFVGAAMMRDTARTVLVQQRVERVSSLLDLLNDDLHPGKDIALSMDLEELDEERKKVWSGRGALSGDPKAKYVDVWLYLQWVNADRSRVRLRVTTKAKTKDGYIRSQSSRVKITVRPSSLYGFPRTWGSSKDLAGFRPAVRCVELRQNVQEDFALPVLQKLEPLYRCLERRRQPSSSATTT